MTFNKQGYQIHPSRGPRAVRCETDTSSGDWCVSHPGLTNVITRNKCKVLGSCLWLRHVCVWREIALNEDEDGSSEVSRSLSISPRIMLLLLNMSFSFSIGGET